MTIPSSTYRVQLHAGFTFRHLEEILDYLHELGISTVYASPITTAVKGSQHGYDVTDSLVISPEIGTEEELERLAGILKKYNMGWLQDIVPNHMAFDSRNAWLYDMLERGQHSEYYHFFDIDTDHSGELTGTRIMAPFLGKTLTECLQNKELTLEFNLSSGNGFVIRYYDTHYPVSVASYQWICTIADGYPAELLSSIRELEQAATLPAKDWAAEKKKWLAQVEANEEWKSFLRKRITFFNEQSSLLAELLNSQHYILTHAHLAASRINYRRFFTVNSLICLRMEDPAVFSAYHSTIREWVKKKYIQGLRIDHIDGLAFPGRYLRDLKVLMGHDSYIVAEKILAADEPLPEDWQLEGATGYEFLSVINQLLMDENGYREIQAFYREQTLDDTAYEDIVFTKKYDFLRSQMGGEWNNLMDLLLDLPLLGADKMDRDRLKEALAILMASFPVYRVYPDENPFPEASREIIREAFARARQKIPLHSSGHGMPELNFLEAIFRETGNAKKDEQQKTFQARLTQFTGPLAAKGIEDTTFYVFNPLISRNEVGDNPGITGMEPDEFHEKMIQRHISLPSSLNATTTHDTKRGEDARIRLNWLSSCPSEWIERVVKWKSLNRAFIHEAKDNTHAETNAESPLPPMVVLPGRTTTSRTPSANDEYLIYQSLLGSFPVGLLVTDPYRERCHEYLTKALREAKTNTNYHTPNEPYEKGCHHFLTVILEQESAFLEDFIPFAYKVIRESAPYSLSQELVKLTVPGIPDIYQGAECWDLSLVDPDNRRPVDYMLRKSLLAKIKEEEKKGEDAVLDFVNANQQKGAGKLFTLYKTLVYRKEHPQVFTEGDYIPVGLPSPLLAYIRRYKEDWALVVIPLIRKEAAVPESFSISLPEEAPSDWVNIFTGEQVRCERNSASSGSEGDRSAGGRKAQNSSVGSGNAGGINILELNEGLSQFPVAMFVAKK
jgi:(1->4)-alpha-D-glucan 1-alpha-D-glucosylmutase